MELLTGMPLARTTSTMAKSTTGGSMLAEAFRRDFTPVVFVLSSPESEVICQKNGLSFVDILRPHCHLQSINVPVRTASDQPYRLQEFRLRVFYASDISQPSNEVAEAYLTQLVSDAADEAASEVAGSGSNIPALLQLAHGEKESSWYQRYCRQLSRSLCFSDHETLDHPVACILVVHSGQKDPVSAFRDLYTLDKLPALFTQGTMDPKIYKHFVLLHDLSQGPADRLDGVLAELRGTFGAANCRLLSINSRDPLQEGVRSDMWTRHRLPSFTPPPPTPPKSLMDEDVDVQVPAGHLLSDSDIKEVADMVSEVALKHVIPHMEHKIREYNHQVSANRKGLRNQIKNLWFKKPKEDVPDTPAGVYTHKSMESQIRVLADYALMVRDYELALANYRLLAGDYKSDKAWKHYAGAQEMTGVCLYLLDQSRREMESAMESAYSSYQRSGAANARYATRAALWLVEMYKGRGLFREAALTLMRASLEEASLRAGVLLEQAALCFLRAAPPMLRKYGFHMVLAGNRYNLCAQRKHAVRAYSMAAPVYQGHGWNFISDHCNFTLGRLSAFMGSNEAAVEFFSRLLACSHQSATMQATFLREFLYVVQAVEASGGEKLTVELGLPDVNAERVHVHFEDQRTFASPAAGALPEQMWTSLEEGLVPASDAPTSVLTWMDAPAAHAKSAGQVVENTCVLGEEVGVDVEFANPLRITLQVARVRLICEHAPDSAATSMARIQSSPSLGRGDHASGIADDAATASGSGRESRAVRGKDAEEEPAALPPTPRQRAASYSSLSASAVTAGPLIALEDLREASAAAAAAAAQDGSGAGGEEESPAVSVEEESFELRAAERTVVRLKLRPQREGRVTVVGVQWVLLSDGREAHGERRFAIKGLRQKRRGGGGGGAAAAIPPHMRLHFRVIAAMPRLEMELHGLPEKCAPGELHRLVLELRNTSPAPLKNLRLKSSHPAMLLAGQLADLDTELPACLEVPQEEAEEEQRKTPGSKSSPESPGGAASTTTTTTTIGRVTDAHVFSFPQGTVVGGGCTLLWPLWLHAPSSSSSSSGSSDSGSAAMTTTSLNMCILYEPEEAPHAAHPAASSSSSSSSSSSMRYRTLRSTHSLQVLPALHMRVKVSASPTHVSRYILRADVENKHLTESFWLRQVSCAGGTWLLAPLQPAGVGQTEGAESEETGGGALLSASVAPPQLLPPSSASSLFFNLQAAGAESSGDAPAGAQTNQQQQQLSQNVRLGAAANGGAQALIDLTAGPLGRFHELERALQGQEKEALLSPEATTAGHTGGEPVDVVLVWEQQGRRAASTTIGSNGTRIGTIHACHCRVEEAAAVQWSVEAPSCIQHSFEASPVCRVPLTLHLGNRSPSAFATIRVEAFDPSAVVSTSSDGSETPAGPDRAGWFQSRPSAAAQATAAEGVPGGSSAASAGRGSQGAAAAAASDDSEEQCGTTPVGPYLWSGTTCTTVRDLAPGASERVTLDAVLFGPGVYNLSGYRLTWRLAPSAAPAGGSVAEIRSARAASLQTGSGMGHDFHLIVLPEKVSLI